MANSCRRCNMQQWDLFAFSQRSLKDPPVPPTPKEGLLNNDMECMHAQTSRPCCVTRSKLPRIHILPQSAIICSPHSGASARINDEFINITLWSGYSPPHPHPHPGLSAFAQSGIIRREDGEYDGALFQLLSPGYESWA